MSDDDQPNGLWTHAHAPGPDPDSRQFAPVNPVADGLLIDPQLVCVAARRSRCTRRSPALDCPRRLLGLALVLARSIARSSFAAACPPRARGHRSPLALGRARHSTLRRLRSTSARSLRSLARGPEHRRGPAPQGKRPGSSGATNRGKLGGSPVGDAPSGEGGSDLVDRETGLVPGVHPGHTVRAVGSAALGQG